MNRTTSHYRLPLLASCLLTIAGISVEAQETDTLSTFDQSSRYCYYHTPDLAMQVARFDLPASATLKSVHVNLAGANSEGSCRIRIFGFEGGSPAPYFERDLIPPRTVQKSRSGFEWLEVDLAEQPSLSHRQFFVAIDQLTPGTNLISDRTRQSTTCIGEYGDWRAQLLKFNDGRWQTSEYSFAIRAVVDYDHAPAVTWLEPVTASVGIHDTTTVDGGIAWGDYNGDGKLDLLLNGRLYRNTADTSFVDVTSETGLSGRPKAAAFINLDQDAVSELLFWGIPNTLDSANAVLFTLSQDGTYQKRSLPNLRFAGRPVHFSFADLNLDGYPDIFLTEVHSPKNRYQNRIWLNTGNLDFVADTALVSAFNEQHSPILTLQSIPGSDSIAGRILTIGAYTGEPALWTLSTNLQPIRVLTDPTRNHAEESTLSYPRDWVQIPEMSTSLLSPGNQGTFSTIGSEVPHNAVFDEVIGTGEILPSPKVTEYSEYIASTAWIDVDNDGSNEAFMASAHPCYQARLIKISSHAIQEISSEYGFLNLPVGPDGIWIDYDNDGKLDLATMYQGRFVLLRNTDPNANSWTSIRTPTPLQSGGTIDVYTDGGVFSQSVTAERGLWMQRGLFTHVGLAGSTRIDSVIGYGLSGEKFVIEGIRINQPNHSSLSYTRRPNDVKSASIHSNPNPFSQSTQIVINLVAQSSVEVSIYSATGSAVRVLYGGELPEGTTTLIWDGTDGNGREVPSGSYTVKTTAGTHTQLLRLVKID